IGTSGYTVAPGDTLYSIAFADGTDVRDLAALNNIPPPYVIHPGQVLKLKPSQPVQPATPVAVGTATATATPPRVVNGAVPVATITKPTPPAAPVFGPVTTQPMTANGVAPAQPAPAVTTTVAAAATGNAAAPAATPTAPQSSAAVQPAQVAPPPASAAATPPPGARHTVAGITWQWPAAGKQLSGFSAGAGGDGAGIDIAGNLGDPVRAAASGTVVYSGNGLIGYGELVIIKHNDTYLSAYGHNSKRLVKEGQHVDAGQEIALMGASGAPRVELHFEIRKDGKPVDPMGYLPSR
ncbi:MAG: peptidoglycan DD-metalloendopeptidase family protein, partial [Rhodanobacteraceae bacterium]